MRDYTLSHLSDAALLRELTRLVVQERATTATVLAHIAEVDGRRLYAPAGYPSMHAYCVEELRLSDDAAYKRIQAARAARRFPALFEEVAAGRLHLTAICLLAPHLTRENAGELILAATHRRKVEIEAWLARRFGVSETTALEPRTVVRAIPALPELAPTQVAGSASGSGAMEGVLPAGARAVPGDLLAPAQVRPNEGRLAPAQVVSPRSEMPLPERYLVQVAISKATHDKLRRAQDLLSHAVPSGDVAQVLDRALEALIANLEKRKFGAPARARALPSSPPRPLRQPRSVKDKQPRESSASGPHHTPARIRHVPAQVRRAVWERDQGQCTFVGAGGRRCEARKFLEYDHVEPVARGGRGTAEGMRLRCRAHNQYEAEQVFGEGFMSRKREEARSLRP